ncbi:MAG: ribonuclease E/G, partial [Thiobacillus sp.]|nr:ribonuclease E/G [Thiobacillus sp.]
YRAIIEVARPARAASPASAQQNLNLDNAPPAAPLPGAVTASPASILAELAAGGSDLQQVETRGAAAPAESSASESGRPRRRRRPTVMAEAEPVSLMQVETSAPVSAADETPAAAPAPHPTRRRPRPKVTVTQEPLIQVETHSD